MTLTNIRNNHTQKVFQILILLAEKMLWACPISGLTSLLIFSNCFLTERQYVGIPYLAPAVQFISYIFANMFLSSLPEIFFPANRTSCPARNPVSADFSTLQSGKDSCDKCRIFKYRSVYPRLLI